MRVRTELMLAGVLAAAAALAAAALVLRLLEGAVPGAVAIGWRSSAWRRARRRPRRRRNRRGRLARLRATAVAYAPGDYSRRLRSGARAGRVLRPLDDAFQALPPAWPH